MTDADLRALFESWLAQPSSAHRTCDVLGAIVRHHGQAMLALPTYPPQVRAPVAAAGAPAGDEASGRCVDGPGDRGHFSNVPIDPAITHAARSPLRADRLPPEVPVAEVSLTRGPIIPRRTEDRA